MYEAEEHAAGVEAAAVVDDDRVLRIWVMKSSARASAAVPVFLPRITSTSAILSTGEKKCRADEILLPGEGFGQLGNRQTRGVRCEQRGVADHGGRLARYFALDGGVLEHIFDHQVDARQIGIIVGRSDPRQHGVGLLLR